MPVSNDIVRLDRSHAKAAIETLVKAFRNEQPFLYYFPDEVKRERIATPLISMAVFSALKYGEVYATSQDMEGIATWMPSENYPITFWRALRAIPLSVTLRFASYGGYSLKRFGQYIDSVHARLAPFKHMYLESLGVDPQFEGKGHAGKLLRHMLTRLDRTDMPCYLETAEEHNVGLYKHFGFRVVDESSVPGTNLTNWAMLRKSRKDTS
jgi:ribosomal protein S18 acetylase RimI-like enzyme